MLRHSILAIQLLLHTNANSSVAVGMVVSLNSAASSSISEAKNSYSHPDNDHDDEKDDEYESKLHKAMQYFQTKSSQLVTQSIQEGGGGVAVAGMDLAPIATMEINPSGDILISSDGNNDHYLDAKLFQTEFALTAMQHELSRLQNRLKMNLPKQDDASDNADGSDSDSDDEEEEQDDEYDDDDDDQDDEEEDDDEGDYGDNFPPENYRLTSEEIDERLQNDPELKAILDAIPNAHTRNEKYGDILSEADVASNMDIDNWHKFRYWEMHAYFSCARQFATSRPVYDMQKWNEVRQLWNDFANEDKLDNFEPGMNERTYQFSNDSFDPPMEAFHAGEKGRGLRAARDIQKGELVFKATNNTVIFTHGHTWRKFLFHIYERNGEDGPYDSGTACDVLLWSWVQRLERDGPLVIVADFDNGSLLNEGRDEIGWDKPNVRCGKEGDEMCMMEYYATDDIKTGEELLCDYREFALLGAWRNMGL